jgi:hypothetical protein
MLLIHTQAELDQFANATAQAKAEGKETFDYPGLGKPIRLAEAEALVPLVQGVISATREGKPPVMAKKIANTRQGLVIATNIEAVEYAEGQMEKERSASLAFAKTSTAGLELPVALRAELKTHQSIGVAWLQHLWRNSPSVYSGCVMADDMG